MYAQNGAPRGSRTPTPFGPWILSPGRLPFRHRGFGSRSETQHVDFRIRFWLAVFTRSGWCPEGESDPHAFRPMDFESRSSAIPTPGLLFINKKSDTSAFILRRYPILPSGPNKLTNILLKPFEDFQLGALYPKTVAFICTSRIECHIGVLRCARTTNARRICRAASPLETACIRRGLKVAARLLSLRGDCLIWATFARRLRAVSTFGLRQMPASQKPAHAGHENAHCVGFTKSENYSNHLLIFRVISWAAK